MGLTDDVLPMLPHPRVVRVLQLHPEESRPKHWYKHCRMLLHVTTMRETDIERYLRMCRPAHEAEHSDADNGKYDDRVHYY